MVTADEIDARQLFSQRNSGLAHKAHHNVHEAEPDSLSRPEHPSQLKSLHSVKLSTEDHFSLEKKSFNRLLIMDLCL